MITNQWFTWVKRNFSSKNFQVRKFFKDKKIQRQKDKWETKTRSQRPHPYAHSRPPPTYTLGKLAKKKRGSKTSRQINDHLRWVSTNRNVRIALSFTTLGSIKVVYSWFETVTQHHIFTRLTKVLIELKKRPCFGIHLSLPAPCTTVPINHRF